MKSATSNQIAQAMISRYVREIDELRRKTRLTARDIARLRELRGAAQAIKGRA